MRTDLPPRLLRIAAPLIAATRWWRVLLLFLLVAVSTLAIMPRPPASIDFGWDKLNHVLAFATLACSAGLGFPAARASRFVVPLALLAYGGLIELLQRWVPQRSGEWGDLLADVIGIACGMLVASAVRRATKPASGAGR